MEEKFYEEEKGLDRKREKGERREWGRGRRRRVQFIML
jgi:hypothetical protein